MKIKYIHHSGFILEDEKLALMIDCCGLTRESEEIKACTGKPLYIMASHSHGDHYDPEILNMGDESRKIILSEDIRKKIRKPMDIHYIDKGGVYRDELLTIKAYGSTDVGVSFYIETAGFKIFHAGDLNNWHWNEEETPQDAAKNEKFYLDELKLIAAEVPSLDALMFPIDPRLGKDYTRGAEQFLDRIKVGLFIPMHFWDNSKAANAFKQTAESKGCRFAEIKPERNIFEVTAAP